MTRVIGAVLAAGAGSRMGRPKAELELDGQRLIDRVVDALTAAGCVAVLAVVRPGVDVPGVAEVIVNPLPDRGMGSSLRLAVDAAHAESGRSDALAVVLVDMPGVGPDTVRDVIAAWRPGRIAVASYAGVRAPPTVMSPTMWRAALQAHAADGGDRGARDFLAAHPDLVDEIAVDSAVLDLDTPEDLSRWLAAPP